MSHKHQLIHLHTTNIFYLFFAVVVVVVVVVVVSVFSLYVPCFFLYFTVYFFISLFLLFISVYLFQVNLVYIFFFKGMNDLVNNMHNKGLQGHLALHYTSSLIHFASLVSVFILLLQYHHLSLLLQN